MAKSKLETLPAGTPVKVSLFGEIIGQDGRYYIVCLFGVDGASLDRDKAVFLKAEEVRSCKKHPEFHRV